MPLSPLPPRVGAWGGGLPPRLLSAEGRLRLPPPVPVLRRDEDTVLVLRPHLVICTYHACDFLLRSRSSLLAPLVGCLWA
eukprot:15448322-Alexandrium_andersonii.AAC.1